MPNGGISPCCQLCKWQESTKEPTDPERKGPIPIHCGFHHMAIFLPYSYFCSELFDQAKWFERVKSQILEKEDLSIQSGSLYQWLEFSPHPGAYIHKPVTVASIQEYSTWTEQQALEKSQKLHAHYESEMDDND